MERAARHPVRALLLELHVILNDPDDVCLSFEIVDECLGVTHYLKVSHGFSQMNTDRSVITRVNLWLNLLSQLDQCCTSATLIGWGG